ncbi:MAG TPA: NAD-dependent epimerase/dehydratase family protein [Myxococcales bacterium]
MKAVLVTGGTTPLGIRLSRTLLDQGLAERVLCAGAESREGVAPLLAGSNVRYLRCDLTRSRSLREMLFGPVAESGVEAVVHLATHRLAGEEGESVHALNVGTVHELLHLCERVPTLRRFVYRSFGEVYRVRHREASVMGEDHPLETAADAPQWLRDRVLADREVCSALGVSRLQIFVLRCAECFSPGMGSQLWDYTRSRLCFRPLGFDPMLNLISLDDLVRAHVLALSAKEQGVYNVPGLDTLPLSEAVALSGGTSIPALEPLLAPLYALRRLSLGFDFRYDLARVRFHLGGVLDGTKALEKLGYRPATGIVWPRSGEEVRLAS